MMVIGDPYVLPSYRYLFIHLDRLLFLIAQTVRNYWYFILFWIKIYRVTNFFYR